MNNNIHLESFKIDIQLLCEKYPDLHILGMAMVDKSVWKIGENTHTVAGNFCAVCAMQDITSFVKMNRIEHNGKDNR